MKPSERVPARAPDLDEYKPRPGMLTRPVPLAGPGLAPGPLWVLGVAVSNQFSTFVGLYSSAHVLRFSNVLVIVRLLSDIAAGERVFWQAPWLPTDGFDGPALRHKPAPLARHGHCIQKHMVAAIVVSKNAARAALQNVRPCEASLETSWDICKDHEGCAPVPHTTPRQICSPQKSSFLLKIRHAVNGHLFR